MDDCIFCKIVGGAIPAEKVYEDGQTLAFLDIRPTNPGHTLVIPKAHYRNVFDIPLDVWGAVMQTVHRLAPAIITATGAGGLNINTNNDEAANQLVFHSHVHLIPRFTGDGHQPWGGTPYAPGEAATLAEKIKNAQD